MGKPIFIDSGKGERTKIERRQDRTKTQTRNEERINCWTYLKVYILKTKIFSWVKMRGSVLSTLYLGKRFVDLLCHLIQLFANFCHNAIVFLSPLVVIEDLKLYRVYLYTSAVPFRT